MVLSFIAYSDLNVIYALSILLDIALKGTLLLAIAIAIRPFLRNCSAAFRHCLCFSTLFSLLLLPFLSLALPAYRLELLPAGAAPSRASLAEPRLTINHSPAPSWFTPTAIPWLLQQRVEPQDVPSAASTVADDKAPATTAIAPPVSPAISAPSVSPMQMDSLPRWPTIFLAVWAGGFFFFAGWWIVSYLVVRAIIRKASALDAAALHFSVPLQQTDRLHIPATIGILRPTIVVPIDFPKWPVNRQKVVLLHEMAHIQRRDFLTQALGQLVLAIYWFHPLAWLTVRHMRLEAEHACDDMVLNAGEPSSDYAEHLIDVAQSLRYRIHSTAGVAMAGSHPLTSRLRAILDSSRNRRAISIPAMVFLLTAGMAIALPLASVHLAQKTMAETPAATSRATLADLPGTVVDETGRPIAGATLTNRVSRFGSEPFVTTHSDSSGQFMLAELPRARTRVTVSAAGFAPQIILIDLNESLDPMHVVLSKAHTLRFQFVTPDGTPLGGVRARSDYYHLMDSLSWTGTADAAGRLDIGDAPADRIRFMFEKDGYAFGDEHYITASNDIARIVGYPNIPVVGSVTDASTGDLIPQFQIYAGEKIFHRRPVIYRTRQPIDFSNGQYSIDVISAPPVVASGLLVSADGYRAVTVPIANDVTLPVDIQLERAAPLTGIVYTPDGHPAAGARIRLALHGATIFWGDDHEPEADHVFTCTADSDGRYALPTMADPFDLVVTHESGFAVVPGNAIDTTPAITIKPFATITIDYAPDARPVARQLIVSVQDVRFNDKPATRFLWHTMATTDAAGHATIHNVPCWTDGPITIVIGEGSGNDLDNENSRWYHARVSPGQTLQLASTGIHPSIHGRVQPATPSDGIQHELSRSILLTRLTDTPMNQWPVNLDEAAMHGEPLFRTGIQADGSFTIHNIPAGNYHYYANVTNHSDSSLGTGTLTIPPAGASNPVDLGTIAVTRYRSLAAGEDCPPFLGRTLDGQPITLSDYTGRYVVIALWNTVYNSPAIPAALAQFADAHRADDRLAFVSLNTDTFIAARSGFMQRPTALPGSAWQNGYIPPDEPPGNLHYRVENQPAILIVDPTGKVIATDCSIEQAEQILNGL